MHCVHLGESFPTHIFLQNFASIQQRMSLVKFLVRKSFSVIVRQQAERLVLPTLFLAQINSYGHRRSREEAAAHGVNGSDPQEGKRNVEDTPRSHQASSHTPSTSLLFSRANFEPIFASLRQTIAASERRELVPLLQKTSHFNHTCLPA